MKIQRQNGSSGMAWENYQEDMDLYTVMIHIKKIHLNDNREKDNIF